MTGVSFAEYGAGVSFGAALFVSGVYSPSVISAQLHLTNFHMMKTFMTASAASAIIMYIADRTKYAAMKVKNPQNLGFFTYDGNLIGGAMIGIGMALTGACPGTVLVQSGISSISSGRNALLGGALGGLIHVLVNPHLQRMKHYLAQPHADPPPEEPLNHTVWLARSSSNPGSTPTIHATLNLSPLTVLAAWEATCALVISLVSALDPSKGQPQLAGLTSPVVGGLAIGAAQAAVVLLTKHAVGCSGVYKNVGCYIQSALSSAKTHGRAVEHLLQPASIFALGIVSAAVALGFAYPPSLSSVAAAAVGADPVVVPIKALVGGAVMAFGASVAGGCTSGHGISGLVTFSFASFVSVAAMFGAGIATSLLFI